MYAINKVKGNLIKNCHRPVNHTTDMTNIKTVNLEITFQLNEISCQVVFHMTNAIIMKVQKESALSTHKAGI